VQWNRKPRQRREKIGSERGQRNCRDRYHNLRGHQGGMLIGHGRDGGRIVISGLGSGGGFATFGSKICGGGKELGEAEFKVVMGDCLQFEKKGPTMLGGDQLMRGRQSPQAGKWHRKYLKKKWQAGGQAGLQKSVKAQDEWALSVE